MEAINVLIAKANKSYAFGTFEEAVDLYAHAVEDLTELNGANNPANADSMLLYGRALVKLALQKSEVLGGTAPIDNSAHDRVVNESTKTAQFSFEGEDAEFEDVPSDSDNEEQAANISSEDDFQNAWEVLDLARVLLAAQLESAIDPKEQTVIRKRLSETYDLLGEVSLENENFDQAVSDLKEALALKHELYDETSSQISGAHYMLALALEYCTSEASRKEAVVHVEKAIHSFELRLKPSNVNDAKLRDEREMLAELRLKLSELRNQPDKNIAQDVKNIFNSEEAALKQSVVQAMQASNDISTLVRKKEKRVLDDGASEAKSIADKRVKHEEAPDSSRV